MTRRLLGRIVVVLIGGVAVLYLGALVIASRPAFKAALRDRIEHLLRSRLGEVRVGPEVEIDPLFRVSFGPVTIPGTRRADPPVVRVARVHVRPRLAALLAFRAEPASVSLQDVRIEAGRSGRALVELADRLPARSPRHAVPGAPERPPPEAAREEHDDPVLTTSDLRLHLTVAGRSVELGPLALTLRRQRRSGRERIDVDLRAVGGARGSFSATREGARWSGEAHLAGLGASALPEALRDLPITLEAGALSLDVSGEAPADLSRARLRGRVVGEGLVVQGHRLGEEPLGPVSASAAGVVECDRAARRVAVRDGALTLPGDARIAVTGEVRLGPGIPFTLSARADGLDFAAFTAALPPSLGLPEDAPHPTGTLDARLDLGGPLVAPGAWSVDAGLDLGRMREAARRAPPVALRAPFVHRPEVDHGKQPTIVVGPRSPAFVPIGELPVHVVRAVTASEDGGFFGHQGFDFQELRNAFAAGAERGRVVRGGSTITQQLAKNLYLSREKTLARKLREAAVTVALEATVPKSRLLEIYLNVAEWGPGIWGIEPAARHWFGKDARALTPKEAAFLATVIPNPVRYHVMWSRGALTGYWEQRVDELLLKMLEQGAITDEEFAQAIVEPVIFARPEALAQP